MVDAPEQKKLGGKAKKCIDPAKLKSRDDGCRDDFAARENQDVS